MRFSLLFLASLGVLTVRAAEVPRPDPLAVLIAQLSVPADEVAAAAPSRMSKESSARLAGIQSSLTAAAAGFEALRASSRAAAAKEALAVETDPALRPFLKSRDSALDAIYRTLAVIDYTWALRFPNPSCAPGDKRSALLRSPDGLFIDPDVGSLSPWMARLLGPDSFGREPEAALDQASAATRPTASEYEKLRVRASVIGDSLSAGKAADAGRAELYCERAGLYEQLSRAHRSAGPTLASRASGNDDPSYAASSVFLLAAPDGNDFDVLGAAFLIRTEHGPMLLTDASIVRGRRTIFAFSRPAAGRALGRPIPIVIERSANGVGPALGRLLAKNDAPALALAEASPAADELVTGLGPLSAAGPWSATQGLVTGAGAATFSSDAVLSAEMAGSPVLNDRGEAAGLIIRRGSEAAALKVEVLRSFLSERAPETPGADFTASRNTGSASLLTEARPVDAYPWSAPGGKLKWAEGRADLPFRRKG